MSPRRKKRNDNSKESPVNDDVEYFTMDCTNNEGKHFQSQVGSTNNVGNEASDEEDAGIENDDGNEDGDEEDSDFHESEYEVSDDDQLFEANIDKDIEWAGIRRKAARTEGESLNIPTDFGDIESDDVDSDELQSVDGSSNEDEPKRPKCPEFRAATDMKDPTFKVGMLFRDANEFRAAVREHAIKHGRDIKFRVNEGKRVRAVCREGCKWVIYASKKQGENTFQVKTYESEHKCGRIFQNRNVKSSWLCKRYVDKIRSNPKWPIESFRDSVREDFVVGVSKDQLYRAKKRAMIMIEGSQREQYRKLWDYCEELKRTNPGTTTKMKVTHPNENGEPVFERLYICLAACKDGMKACRPIIGLDGCHIKGPHPGQLLTAIAIDANNSSFPLAYAVVEGENKSSWTWFLELLIDDIGIVNQHGWTFISDQQKGLIPTFNELLPDVDNRFCVRHMYSNFRDSFKGKALKDIMWNAARSTTVSHFEYHMGEMEKMDKAAFEWLSKKLPSTWSRSHFSTYPKCDMLLNNLCESFNGSILEARDKPILTMLETIRCFLMKRFQVRREKMSKYEGEICPKIQKIIEKNKKESGSCIPMWSGEGKFQIACSMGDQYSVNLDELTCSCRKWDLTGIPCSHGISAIFYKSGQPEDYVHYFYKKETYIMCYNPIINPMNGFHMWPKTGIAPVLPPIYKKQPGRPKRARRKSLRNVAVGKD